VAYHAPEPVVYHEVEEVYPDDPPVYHYTYAVEDEYEGANHSAEEESDEYNNIHGSYQVIRIDLLKYFTFSSISALLLLLSATGGPRGWSKPARGIHLGGRVRLQSQR